MDTVFIVNITIGRPLVKEDIVDSQTYPIDQADSGEVYCHVCEKYHSGEQLQPLTSSSGVFTSAITCEMGSPVWVCLDHAPYNENEFDAFTPAVQEALRLARQESLCC
jgi:hypothetical protein